MNQNNTFRHTFGCRVRFFCGHFSSVLAATSRLACVAVMALVLSSLTCQSFAAPQQDAVLSGGLSFSNGGSSSPGHPETQDHFGSYFHIPPVLSAVLIASDCDGNALCQKRDYSSDGEGYRTLVDTVYYSYRYDKDDNPQKELAATYVLNAKNELVYEESNRYDKIGQLTETTQSRWVGNVAGAAEPAVEKETIVYIYDAARRVVDEKRTLEQVGAPVETTDKALAYDAVDNNVIKAVSENAQAAELTDNIFSGTNRETQTCKAGQCHTLLYTPAGNQLNDADGQNFAYNTNNQLIARQAEDDTEGELGKDYHFYADGSMATIETLRDGAAVSEVKLYDEGDALLNRRNMENGEISHLFLMNDYEGRVVTGQSGDIVYPFAFSLSDRQQSVRGHVNASGDLSDMGRYSLTGEPLDADQAHVAKDPLARSPIGYAGTYTDALPAEHGSHFARNALLLSDDGALEKNTVSGRFIQQEQSMDEMQNFTDVNENSPNETGGGMGGLAGAKDGASANAGGDILGGSGDRGNSYHEKGIEGFTFNMSETEDAALWVNAAGSAVSGLYHGAKHGLDILNKIFLPEDAYNKLQSMYSFSVQGMKDKWGAVKGAVEGNPVKSFIGGTVVAGLDTILMLMTTSKGERQFDAGKALSTTGLLISQLAMAAISGGVGVLVGAMVNSMFSYFASEHERSKKVSEAKNNYHGRELDDGIKAINKEHRQHNTKMFLQNLALPMAFYGGTKLMSGTVSSVRKIRKHRHDQLTSNLQDLSKKMQEHVRERDMAARNLESFVTDKELSKDTQLMNMIQSFVF